MPKAKITLLPESESRTIPRRPRLTHSQFHRMAWAAIQQIALDEPHRTKTAGIGSILIPRLRRALATVPFLAFNSHLLRMERDKIVRLTPPYFPDALADDDRRDSLLHADGSLRSFLVWDEVSFRPGPGSLKRWGIF
jgi:hypothetical protein